MKINEQQLLQIEKYLDLKELVQIDLRNEVLDHMAANIEKNMEDGIVNFKEAFYSEKELWNNDLQNSSNFWLGWYWVGPKILIQKCVKEIKKMYLSSTLAIAGFFLLISFFSKAFQIELFSNQINISLGVLYLLIFIFVLVGFYKMKVSKIETTYRYLFKINAIGFCFMYLVFNPLWSESLSNSLFNGNSLFAIILHGFLLMFGSHFMTLYQKHTKVQKRVLV
jgi:hypothetical protein